MPFISREIPLGNIVIGGRQPLVIQSMTNTDTMNTGATVKQVEELYHHGCQMVRITAPSVKEAENLAVIKKRLIQKGVDIPLIADIHFQPAAAEAAARRVEKVRINPGNYVDKQKGSAKFAQKEYELELEKIHERLLPLINICNRYGTAVRLGINHGSLSQRILYRYGNTVEGMVQSALEFMGIFEAENFHNLTLSLKSSRVPVMIAANRLLVKEMIRRGKHYPLHLGITEAGAGEPARVKSAAGIGLLLSEGIGDTIRVSLTENPVREIPFAKRLAGLYPKGTGKHYLSGPGLFAFADDKPLKEKPAPVIVSSHGSKYADFIADNKKRNKTPEHGKTVSLIPVKKETDKQVLKFSCSEADGTGFLIRMSVSVAKAAEKSKFAGLWIENEQFDAETSDRLAVEILQALRLRFSKTEYIACPSCGRTRFDIMTHLKKIQNALPDVPNLKIAVMGCIVNGTGEMGDADFGYVGTGPGKITLYKGKYPVLKNITEKQAVERLVALVKQNFPNDFSG